MIMMMYLGPLGPQKASSGGACSGEGERLQGLEHNRQIHQAVKAYVRRAAPVRQNSLGVFWGGVGAWSGSWFRVRVYGSGFRVQGSGFRVQGLCLGFRV